MGSYSKFARTVEIGIMLPSRLGMALLYAPSSISAAYCLANAQSDASRADIIAMLMLAHFSKRVFECCCVHNYSGDMPLTSSIFISIFYILVTATSIHYARLVPEELYQNWTLTVGMGAFALGQAGNFYHHY